MSTETRPGAKRGKIFYGWWIVLASALNAAYGSGIWFYGFGVYFKAIQEEFGWGRAVTGAVTSISRAEGSIMAPIAGTLIDRIGPRKLAIFCAALVGGGYILLSRVHSATTFLLAFALMMSVGSSIVFYNCGSAAIANWFQKKVSRAFGFYTAGNGVGPAIILPVLAWLMVRYGWRAAALISGIGMFVLVLPLGFVFRHKPEPYGYRPDGAAAPAHSGAVGADMTAATVVETEVSFTLRQAMRTSTFWLLLLIEAFRSIGISSVVTHQVAYLNDLGYSYAYASTVLGLMTLFNVPGTFIIGWLGDVMDIRYPMMICSGLLAVGAFALSDIRSVAFIYIYVVLFGLGFGGQMPLNMAMLRKYFGRQSFATIRGYRSFFLLPATIIGPVLAGWLYDISDSYRVAFLIVVVVYILAGVLTFFARKPRLPVESAAVAVPR